jgi:DNA helicase-2/ATP-dependent DNA helicase PcrA
MAESSKLCNDILEKPTPLSEDQRNAVLSTSRYTKIVAGAGAGKTETLTRRIAYLLLIEKASPSSIIAFTFTEKAAQSMKSRIYQRIMEISGSGATNNLGEMYIGTIHAYAKRILEDYFKFGNHGVLDDNQEIAFLMRHGWSLKIQDYGAHYAISCRNFLRTVNMVWGEMLDEKDLEGRALEFHTKLKKYENLLKKHRQLTFGRMIQQAVVNLKSAPDTLRGIRHLVVDEYQDINKAQQDLIELIGKNSSIFVVGDPRQSIYQWRGSDERFFDAFSQKFGGTEITRHRDNYKGKPKKCKQDCAERK